ncbi:MAG: hypothetical protein ACPGOY_15310 [Rhodospirillaceae bacterium]
MVEVYIVVYGLLILIPLYFLEKQSLRERSIGVSLRYYAVLVMVIPAALISMKGLYVTTSHNDIAAEIIGPSHPTEHGQHYLEEVTTLDPNEDLIEQYAGKSLLFDFIQARSHKTKEEKRNWIIENGYTAAGDILFRGRILHHYSVVTTPFRDMQEGNWAAGVTAQYGLLSVLPLYFINGSNYTFYTGSSVFLVSIVLIFAVAQMTKSGASPYARWGLIILALLAALVANEGALRFSPGFSAYRIIPIVFLGLIFLFHERMNIILVITLALLCAFLNSIQFNILFTLAIVGYLGLSTILTFPSVASLKNAKAWAMIAVLVGVAVFQYQTYQSMSNAFTPPLFGSIEKGRGYHWGWAGFIAFFPLICIASAYYIKLFSAKGGQSENSTEESGLRRFKPMEIFSLVAYGTFASYSMSFYGSPQHYVSFLLFASPMIVLLFSRCFERSKVMGVLACLGLLFPSWQAGYWSLPTQIGPPNHDVFHSVPFGTTLRYQAQTDVGALDAQYRSLMETLGATDQDTYLISRDKIYFEEFRGQNLLPKSYDAFVNARTATLEAFQADLKRFEIKYVVFDSEQYVDGLRELLRVYGPRHTGVQEHSHYIEILDHVETLRQAPFLSLDACQGRYCFYAVSG